MLMKLTPGVDNFTNMFMSSFYSRIFPNHKKTVKSLVSFILRVSSYAKAAFKMLVTLTRHLGLISSTCLLKPFTQADPKSTKRLFELLAFMHVKAACKMSVKLTPGVKFANPMAQIESVQ